MTAIPRQLHTKHPFSVETALAGNESAFHWAISAGVVRVTIGVASFAQRHDVLIAQLCRYLTELLD
jgi:hypothetical protein